ncbi:hypothetical protein [Protaetiibacter larvae]|uniref:hypothetical protein n=1 Tax=Protaetiibacter larvae TaxID=2592654 RepID=UPI00143DEEE4|nr:hypothetical protein [Protaetiibacter larvae]
MSWLLPYLSPEGEAAAVNAAAVIGNALIIAIAGWIGISQERIRRHAKATRAQVENSHRTNLRDDVDGLQRAVTRIEDHLGIERTLDHRPRRRRGRWIR